MPESGDLQRRLSKGDYQREVVLFSFNLVGISREGVDPDGAKRPALEAALKRALVAEVGSGAIKADGISLGISASEAAVAPEAKQVGRDSYGSALEEGDSALLLADVDFKSPASNSEAGGQLQPLADEVSPATAAARNTAVACCILSPVASARAADVAAALCKRLALPLSGHGVTSSGPLVDRLAKELGATRDLDAVPGLAVKVTDASRPEVQASSLPEVHLDKKHGIPPKVFRLFDDLRVLEDAWVAQGRGGDDQASRALDAEEIVWSLQRVAEVCRDPQFEKIFVLTIANLLRKDRRCCHKWVSSIAPNNLRQLLCDNPVREQICSRPGGVFEQTAQLQLYAADCKLCVALALAAADSMTRWRDEMAPEDKSWLADAAEKLATVPDMQASQARSLWDRSACRFLIIDLVCRNSSLMDAALGQLRRCPKDVVGSRFKAPWRAEASKEGSFLYLFPHFLRRKDWVATDAFVFILASAFADTPGSDFAGALQAFLEDAELPTLVRRDFLVSFVSVCRLPRRSAEKRQRSTGCFFFKARPSANEKEEEEEEVSFPSLQAVDALVLDVILRDFTAWEAEGRVSDEGGAKRDLAELFEVVLLVADGDALWRWAQDKLANDPTTADNAKRFLNTVAWKHVSDVLRMAAGSTRQSWYVEERVRELVKGTRPWSYDLCKAGKRFSDMARQPAKRQAEDFSQLLMMYFKFDFALGAGSTWSFMQVLEEGSGCLALRLARLAPPGGSLRRALAAEIRRGCGCNDMRASEVENLLKYSGFYNPSFQLCLCDSGLLSAISEKVNGPSDVPLASTVRASLLEAVAQLLGSPGASDGELTAEQALREIAAHCCTHAASQFLLWRVTEVVRAPHLGKSQVDDLTLAQLSDCARELGKAGALLAFKLERRGAPLALLQGAGEAVQAFLWKTAPAGWAATFRTLDTVIFALEYMGKEDLQLAFNQFDAECRSTQDQMLVELIQCVRLIYRSPLAGESPGSISPNMDIADVIRSASPPLDRRVAWCGVAFEPADWQRALEIAAAAAECMRQRYNVLILPHHTQIITLLMFAIRACGARSPKGAKLPKTMLARVGTGEGKSLIIAMIASFVAKRGLRAHVINDKRVLARRDFEASRALFSVLGLSASCDRCDLINKSCQIVYCTGDDVERSCLDGLIEGNVEEYEEGLKEAVLIVDEVDGLIFDKGVVTAQSFEDGEFSDWVTDWFGHLETKGEVQRDWDDFRAQGECTMRIQSEVEQAWQDVTGKKEGIDYAIRGGIPYMLDPKTNLVQEDAWSLWMELLKRQRSDGAYSAKYKYTKAILCRIQCFMSYSCIFGLSGSLGKASEMDYLRRHYEAATFNVPFFLDTCRDERRGSVAELQRPLQLGDRIRLKLDAGDGGVPACPVRLETQGLVGSIAGHRPGPPEEFLVDLSDGRALWYPASCLERGAFQGKCPPRLVPGTDLLPDQDSQERAVVELAASKCTEVPVLVLAKDPEAVARIAAALRERVGDDCGDRRAVIELLHDPARPQDFVDLVQLATEPLPGGPAATEVAGAYEAAACAGGGDIEAKGTTPEPGAGYHDYQGFDNEESTNNWNGCEEGAAVDGQSLQHEGLEAAGQGQAWRITVSTAEGGRGHDYRVVDPSIDERGGLLLILTWVPWSEREWIQFLGRTARQDHVGQYAVLLNAEDEQVIAGTEHQEEGESTARAILRHGETQAASLLQGKGVEITKGRLMHKLTSRFWTLHKVKKTSKRQDWDWKRLCENYLDFTADAIQHVFSTSVIPPKELVLGFAKMDRNAPLRPGLAEQTCEKCGTVNIFPRPAAGHEMPTVRCGNCGETA